MPEEKTQLGILEDSLVNKLDNYADLTNNSRMEVLRILIKDFFKDKVVTKDKIELETPLYFNMKELLKNKSVIATSKPSVKNRLDVYVVKKIPNNLDSFNEEFKSYCYGNESSNHRGIYIYYDLKDKPVPIPLVFDFTPEELSIDYFSNINDLMDLTENEEDIRTIDELIENVKNADNIPLTENYEVIENIGRLNKINALCTIEEKGIETKHFHNLGFNDSEINNPVEAIIEENKKIKSEKSEIINQISSIKNKIDELDSQPVNKKKILDKIGKKIEK